MEGRFSVQIEFTLRVPEAAYLAHAESVVPAMRALPGLQSKVWIVSEDGRRAGGLYLFRDAASAKAYVEGPIVAGLRASPNMADVSVRVSRVVESLTAATNAPAEAAA
jgi:Putative mono-oxygenase ydhR